MTADLSVRPATPADLEAAARVYTLARPGNPATAERLHAEDAAQESAGAHHRRWLAVAGEQVVGAAEIVEPLGARAAGSFWMELAVLEEWRGQGAGTLLYRALLTDAHTQGLHRLRAVASEANPVALSFAARRGFQEVERFWDRTLDLDSFDAARHLHRLPAGVDFMNLSEFRARHSESRAAWPEALHTLNEEARQDLPRLPGEVYTPLPVSDMAAFLAPLDPELVLIAVRAGQSLEFTAVGFTALAPSGSAPAASSGLLSARPAQAGAELLILMTGVARAERGKGVARAVKVASLRAAQAAGWGRVRTTNHSSNLPMMRVNDALGFAREPARLGMLKIS